MDQIRKRAETSLFFLRLDHRIEQLRCLLRYVSRSDERAVREVYQSVFHRPLDLDAPQTLNEKLQWLKLYDHKAEYTVFGDKYAVRDYIARHFGEELLVPLLFSTTSWRDIRKENIPDVPCIVKASHDSGHNLIIRDKEAVDYPRLRENCRYWLHTNYYHVWREWHYKDIRPRRILIEKLLLTRAGKIPNDYKLHFIDGQFQFIYVSFDRQGVNDRCIYDSNWNRLPFVWVPGGSYRPGMNTAEVPRPASFDEMLRIGREVARGMHYVRVDFYDVDGKLYMGEITLSHGSGFDSFFPAEYDRIYGAKMDLAEELPGKQ